MRGPRSDAARRLRFTRLTFARTVLELAETGELRLESRFPTTAGNERAELSAEWGGL
jgi:hypothetical protein